MALARVSTKGQIVIPKAIRDELGLRPRTYVALREEDEVATVTVLGDDPIEAGYGALAHLGPGTPGLLEDKREERELEERKEAWLRETVFRGSSSTRSR